VQFSKASSDLKGNYFHFAYYQRVDSLIYFAEGYQQWGQIQKMKRTFYTQILKV